MEANSATSEGKFLKPEEWEIRNYEENFCFY
jgi:hypothetical protein